MMDGTKRSSADIDPTVLKLFDQSAVAPLRRSYNLWCCGGVD